MVMMTCHASYHLNYGHVFSNLIAESYLVIFAAERSEPGLKRCSYALLPGSSGIYISDMTKTESIRNCIGIDTVCTMNASGDFTDCPELLNHLTLCIENFSLGIDADAADRGDDWRACPTQRSIGPSSS